MHLSSSISLIDNIIVAAYLLFTLFIGIRSGRNKSSSTMKEYALGNKDFATYALMATMTASFISGNGVMGITSEIYKKGVLFGAVFFGFPVSILLTKYILAG